MTATHKTWRTLDATYTTWIKAGKVRSGDLYDAAVDDMWRYADAIVNSDKRVQYLHIDETLLDIIHRDLLETRGKEIHGYREGIV